VAAAFGQFQRTDKRPKLTAKLKRFVTEAQKSGIVAAIIIDGSYVTGKSDPWDIDIVVAIRADINLTESPPPFAARVKDRPGMKREFGFDIFAHPEGSEAYLKIIDEFSTVRKDDPKQASSHERKGLLRTEI